jgi:hypothetical protein
MSVTSQVIPENNWKGLPCTISAMTNPGSWAMGWPSGQSHNRATENRMAATLFMKDALR